MATFYSNKWLSGNLPTVNQFFVDKNHTKYYIGYFAAKKNVVELNNNMNAIKSAVETLKSDIESLKQSIDSTDYRNQTDSVISAIDSAVKNIDANMQKLFTSVSNRLASAAETDAWFGTSAANYSNYINQTILKK